MPEPTAPTANWFYATQGQQAGPVTPDVLRQLAAGGRLSASDLVWTEGMPQWTPAGQVPGLLPAAPHGGPPPLPAQPVGYRVPPPPAYDAPADPGLRWIVPVGRSGWAIAAGYLGLFSVLMLPAPIALVVSIIAIRDVKKHPGRGGMGRAVFGLVMGALFSVVFALVLIANVVR